MNVVFTKYPPIVLQANLPRRAEPTQLKAIFEKVGFYFYTLFRLPLFEEASHLSFNLCLFLFITFVSGFDFFFLNSMPSLKPQSCWLERWIRRKMGWCSNISLVVSGDQMFHINYDDVVFEFETELFR